MHQELIFAGQLLDFAQQGNACSLSYPNHAVAGTSNPVAMTIGVHKARADIDLWVLVGYPLIAAAVATRLRRPGEGSKLRLRSPAP
jgi:hypothetical protein